MKALEAAGLTGQHTLILDRDLLGLGASLVVLVMIRTGHHSAQWLTPFSEHSQWRQWENNGLLH